ncbi:unnamed protein product [Paramecium pentaurelia]|uniref:Transmembrane protein n=1 Tax=Paramecium pentaurelia TaxID=43138 RepID=A0A8S1U793_9CILI|nr:unnamed protein product [Paramecium pentaurelia]
MQQQFLINPLNLIRNMQKPIIIKVLVYMIQNNMNKQQSAMIKSFRLIQIMLMPILIKVLFFFILAISLQFLNQIMQAIQNYQIALNMNHPSSHQIQQIINQLRTPLQS